MSGRYNNNLVLFKHLIKILAGNSVEDLTSQSDQAEFQQAVSTASFNYWPKWSTKDTAIFKSFLKEMLNPNTPDIFNSNLLTDLVNFIDKIMVN